MRQLSPDQRSETRRERGVRGVRCNLTQLIMILIRQSADPNKIEALLEGFCRLSVNADK